MGVDKYRDGFSINVHESALGDPLKWRRPRLVFVNSMSDLFPQVGPVSVHRGRVRDHESSISTHLSGAHQATEPCRPAGWKAALDAEHLARHEHRIRKVAWTVGAAQRKPTPRTKFLSLEPLLGPLPSIQLQGIDWVIVGGESGPGARPMEADWVRDIRDNCLAKRRAVLFQTMGRRIQKKNRPYVG